MLTILGISRSPQFSPNSVDRDAAIFAAVSSRLRRAGHEVYVITEDLYITVDLSELDLVFSMARSTFVLEALEEAARSGKVCVVNNPTALLQGNRLHLMQAFQEAGLPQPAFARLLLNQDVDFLPLPPPITYPVWLKRADACAQSAADVQYAPNEQAVREVVGKLSAQGVAEVLAVSHVPGDLIKFYGVQGTDFFHYSYPTEGDNFSKFGLEAHNGSPSHYAVSVEALKALADCAAEVSGFTIYGGDAIVSADGRIWLIDFNDWPSFSSCRRQAATAIAARLTACLQQA